jgi:hypothetical protein
VQNENGKMAKTGVPKKIGQRVKKIKAGCRPEKKEVWQRKN